MKSARAKREAAAAGLQFYWSPEWQSWGLIDPEGRVEGDWFSSASFREMSDHEWNMAICVMQEKIYPDAGGEFPIAADENSHEALNFKRSGGEFNKRQARFPGFEIKFNEVSGKYNAFGKSVSFYGLADMDEVEKRVRPESNLIQFGNVEGMNYDR